VRLVAEAEHADALREADRLKDALLHRCRTTCARHSRPSRRWRTSIGAEGDDARRHDRGEADRLKPLRSRTCSNCRGSLVARSREPRDHGGGRPARRRVQRVSGALGSRTLEVSLDPDDRSSSAASTSCTRSACWST
jgi:hypothetical protein